MIKLLDRTLLPVIDRISWVLAMIAMVQIALLIVAMLYEVVLRYGLDSPTLWSNDVVKYLNGTLFLLAAGWTLRKNQHVRIDFLAVRLPVRASAFSSGAAAMLIASAALMPFWRSASLSALRMARTCMGVVPQQPPIRRALFAKKIDTWRAKYSGLDG